MYLVAVRCGNRTSGATCPCPLQKCSRTYLLCNITSTIRQTAVGKQRHTKLGWTVKWSICCFWTVIDWHSSRFLLPRFSVCGDCSAECEGTWEPLRDQLLVCVHLLDCPFHLTFCFSHPEHSKNVNVNPNPILHLCFSFDGNHVERLYHFCLCKCSRLFPLESCFNFVFTFPSWIERLTVLVHVYCVMKSGNSSTDQCCLAKIADKTSLLNTI